MDQKLNKIMRRARHQILSQMDQINQGIDVVIGAVNRARYNPNLATRVLCAMMLAASVGGVIEYKLQDGQEDVWGNFDHFNVTPHSDPDQRRSDLDAVHPYVLAHIISSEGFIARAYDDNAGRGTLTLGSGFTIDDADHRRFASRILGRHVGNGASISIEENRILVSAWLHERIYPKICRDIKVPISGRLFVILAVAAYNKGDNIFAPGNSGASVAAAINSGAGANDIVAAYVSAFAGIRGTQWGGLPNKYGLCALYYLGHVSDTALLQSVAEAPYALESKIKENGGRLVTYQGRSNRARATGVYNPGNLDSLLLSVKKRVTKGSVQLPIASYLTPYQCSVIQSGRLAHGGIEFIDVASIQPVQNMSPSQEQNATGEEFYFNGQYADAIKYFKKAVESDPRNFIVYSNMALTYHKMGRSGDGLNIIQDLIHSSYFGEMPDDIRGYTYYNVAMCRMGMGDQARQVAARNKHYDMAIANLKLAEKYSGQSHSDLRRLLETKKGQVGGYDAALKKTRGDK